MNQPKSNQLRERGQFRQARADANRAEIVQQAGAARTVVRQAVDAEDCRELLSMLGLQGAAELGEQNLSHRAD
jgi:hypothetical protein